mmetsp:Transcript_37405/g.73611  ORF Transcript_37405/g.73611 Transcript_37405/m.73611 type:complete len:137 (-) Transcript_37405:709-1119(-)
MAGALPRFLSHLTLDLTSRDPASFLRPFVGSFVACNQKKETAPVSTCTSSLPPFTSLMFLPLLPIALASVKLRIPPFFSLLPFSLLSLVCSPSSLIPLWQTNADLRISSKKQRKTHKERQTRMKKKRVTAHLCPTC